MKKKIKKNPRTLVEDEISQSLSREDSPLDSLEVWLDWDSWPWCMAVAPRTAPKNGASGARLKNLVKSWFSDSSRLVLQEMVLLGFWKWCDKRWCSVRAWGYSWPRGLLHWEPSKQKKTDQFWPRAHRFGMWQEDPEDPPWVVHPEEDVFQVIRLSHSYPMTDPNGAAIFVVRNMDPNKNPSHVSIFLPAPAGSVMAFWNGKNCGNIFGTPVRYCQLFSGHGSKPPSRW